jgi:hypothetical protein
MRRKEFQGNLTVKFGVLCQVHLTHPTGADFVDNPVMRNLGASSQGNKGPGPAIM